MCRNIGATNLSTLPEILAHKFYDFKLDISFNPRGGLTVGARIKVGPQH